MVATLQRAEKLKAELGALRPLDKEAERRIMQKFRLDWNYHSNKLEGNSYSYGETRMLILYGLTAGGKPIKDYEEISGHNEAINYIIDIIKDSEPLTEAFIRHLHKLILVKPYHTNAKTSGGQPTKKLVKVGEYKTEPNHVETVTGEIFYFAEPFETPIKMRELVDWYRDNKQSSEINPIILAAEFHYRFIRIHPFDDGNGRMARLLMNFILMQNSFPPVVIKNDDKENYIAVLRQADSGVLEPFVEYITRNLIRSLEIMIKGAKGQSIEEPDDLDKELTLLEQKLKGVGQGFEVTRNKEVLLNLYEQVINPLLYEHIKICQKFERFYVDKNYSIHLNNRGLDIVNFEDLDSVIRNQLQDNTTELYFHYRYKSFNYAGFEGFSENFFINIQFNLSTYKVLENSGLISYEKLYTEYLTQDEIKKFVTIIAKRHKDIIEEKLKEVQSK
ncbi:MAG: Fic family protein [Pyrinomonadaceae bacterium]